MFLLSRVNVDIQNQSVSLAGFNSDIDPEKLPANRFLVINVTEVSLVHQYSVYGTKSQKYTGLSTNCLLTSAVGGGCRSLLGLPGR